MRYGGDRAGLLVVPGARLRGTALVAAGLLILVAAIPRTAGAQPPDGGTRPQYAAGEHPVSPTVWATWIAEADRGIAREILLVVLWRGPSRWYSQIDGGTTTMPPPGGEPLESSFRFGETELSLSFTRSSGIVRVLGQAIALGEDNVILVDAVATTEATPRICGTVRIDPSLAPARLGTPGPTQQITDALGRSTAVRSFLDQDPSAIACSPTGAAESRSTPFPDG